MFKHSGVFWVGAAQSINPLSQFGVFFILTKFLSVDQVGLFLSAYAIIAIFQPFSGYGHSQLLIKYISVDKDKLRLAWGKSIMAILFSSLLFVIPLFGISLFFDQPVMLTLLFILLVNELLFSMLILDISQIHLALLQYKQYAFIRIVHSLLKLAAALIVFFFSIDHMQLIQFLVINAILYAIFYFVSILSTIKNWGKPILNMRRLSISEKYEGIYFSIGQSSRTIYSDIDKAMLLKYVSAYSSGIYSSAYRVMNAALLPLYTLMSYFYPVFFKMANANEQPQFKKFLRSTQKKSLLVGLFVGIMVFICAPLVPLILGNHYKETVDILKLLAVIPIVQSLHLPLADTLTSIGKQKFRSYIQLAVALLCILLNIIVLPTWGIKGAVAVTVLSETLLFIAYLIILKSRFKLL